LVARNVSSFSVSGVCRQPALVMTLHMQGNLSIR
jgi:hypothetical protein